MTTQPVEITVRRYLCPFCRRGRSKRAATVEHIARCWHNPATRSCKTCRYHIPAYSEPDVGWHTRERCGANDTIDLTAGSSPRVACPLWSALPAAEAVH